MRSLPDIYKAPWFYVAQEGTVVIPDYVPEEPEPDAAPEPEQEESDPEEAGGQPEAWEWGAEGDEEATKDRRALSRRQMDRREEDNKSRDMVIRQYRERLRMTEEAFFAAIEGDLREKLQRQMEEVRAETYRDELLHRREEISHALGELDRGLTDLGHSHAAYMREFAEELKYMALNVAERILHKEIETDRTALEALVLQLVSEVKNDSWINVEVSEYIDGLAGRLKDQLALAEQGKTIYVEARDLPADTVRIGTQDGVVDATLSVQLRQLREAFTRAEEERN